MLSMKRFSAVVALIPAVLISIVVTEVEQVEEISKRRTIQRNIGIVLVHSRIWKIIAAAMG